MHVAEVRSPARWHENIIARRPSGKEDLAKLDNMTSGYFGGVANC